jgi:hypothetical protein
MRALITSIDQRLRSFGNKNGILSADMGSGDQYTVPHTPLLQ